VSRFPSVSRAKSTADKEGAARRGRIVFLSGLVPVALTAIFAVYRPAFIPRLDDSVYDVVMRSSIIQPPGKRVVIVDIDERSLLELGQWPWRRDVIGELITRLREMGASVIGLDIIFAETDRLQIPESDGTDPRITPDDVLADVLRQGKVLLGYGLTFDQAGRDRTECDLHPVTVAVLHPPEETEQSPYFHATGAICSLPLLAQAAGGSGFLNAAPDADGILRRVPVVAELDGRLYPSLALAAVRAATGSKDMTLRVLNVNSSMLELDDDLVVPLDGRGNLLARYRGKKGTFQHLSAADILNNRLPPAVVRDRIVLVGTTALGTREVVATPLDTLFAGVEVQATITDNLLERTFIRRSSLGSVLDFQVVVVFGLALSILVAIAGVIPGVIGGVLAITGLWTGSIWLMSTQGMYVSPLLPTIGMVSGLAMMTFAKFVVERRRAEAAGRQRTDAQRLMVQTLLSLTETRDAETGRHSRRTQLYARVLAQELSKNPDYADYLTPERIDLLSSLAPLHDIGKVGIPDHILNKPGPLTPDEMSEMKKHPALGHEVILKAEQQSGVYDDATLAMAKDIVYTHHERWDGTGYPQGLHGELIPVPGRVMAIVDVYDAAVTRTLYRRTMSHEDTVKFIVAGKGTHFDPAVVDAFVSASPVIEHVSREENH
jgi:HD-GYP domain-containing protein (c-di-GMP phosphodiesterase class II)